MKTRDMLSDELHTADDDELEIAGWMQAFNAGQIDAEDAGDQIVAILTDPTRPCNQLKHHVKAICLHCGKPFRRTQKILAAPLTCSTECADAMLAELERIETLKQQTAERALLRAMFGLGPDSDPENPDALHDLPAINLSSVTGVH